MDFHSVTCNDAQLASVLQGDDSSAPSPQILEHIERCPQCQSRLAELAASENQWASAKGWLSGCDSTGSLRSRATVGERLVSDQSAHDWAKSMASHLLEPASHPEMLGRIGRYDVERLIGSGGMGVVFKAYDTELNRPVAIKVLAPFLAGNGAARQRFSREAKAAAAVVHDHVVPIHNVETNATSPFLVMHYVAGESLQSRIDRVGALGTCEILRIAMQVASGLAAAHAHGLVHRDIKPPNILLEQGVERSLITDFGLARTADDASLTNTGVHAGTPQYMSPEQAKGESIDAQSDLFSLGSTMYTMCTGRAPFRADTAYGILRKIIETEPHPIQDLNESIPEWLSDIIARLMAKNPSERFESARSVALLLEECLAHVQTPRQHPLPAILAKPKQATVSIKRVWVGALAIVVLLVALMGWKMTGRNMGRSITNEPTPQRNMSFVPLTEPESPDRIQRWTIRPAAEDNLREKLAESIVTPFESNSPQGMVEYLEQSLNVSIRWNQASFDSSGISPPESLYTLPSSGREALRSVCSQVGGEYIVHENSIEICSTEYAERHPSIRYYDLAHVISSSQYAKTIVQGIEAIVNVESWDRSGGSCSISTIDSVLIIRATESMHAQIELFLSSLTVLQQAKL
jgi:serine/threonine protein kinase